MSAHGGCPVGFADGSLRGIAAVVAKQIPSFFLPNLVAVDGIFLEKSEVGIQLKIVVAVEELVFDDVILRRHRHELGIEVGSAGFAAFCGVNGTKETRQSRFNGPVGNLAGVIPFAPEGRAGQGQVVCWQIDDHDTCPPRSIA